MQLTFLDGLLADIIERLPSSSKYTLLYVTSPREFPETDSIVYESEDAYQDPVHMEIKRDYSAHSSYSRSSDESDRRQSLFDEYQYFTPGTYHTCVLVICTHSDSMPGLFMGLLASFICIMILYVGVSALGSLEIPYAAFERDTSAAVQKKQQ